VIDRVKTSDRHVGDRYDIHHILTYHVRLSRYGDISRYGLDISRYGLDISRYGLDISRYGLDISRYGLDISRYGDM